MKNVARRYFAKTPIPHVAFLRCCVVFFLEDINDAKKGKKTQGYKKSIPSNHNARNRLENYYSFCLTWKPPSLGEKVH